MANNHHATPAASEAPTLKLAEEQATLPDALTNAAHCIAGMEKETQM